MLFTISVKDGDTDSIASGDLDPAPEFAADTCSQSGAKTHIIEQSADSHKMDTHMDADRDNEEISITKDDDTFYSGAMTKPVKAVDDISDFVSNIIKSHKASQSGEGEQDISNNLQVVCSGDSKSLSDEQSLSLETSGQTDVPSSVRTNESKEASLETSSKDLEAKVMGEEEEVENLEVLLDSPRQYIQHNQTHYTVSPYQDAPPSTLRLSFSVDSSITALKIRNNSIKEDDFESLSKQANEDQDSPFPSGYDSPVDSPSHSTNRNESSHSIYQTSDSSTDDFYSKYCSDPLYSPQKSDGDVSIEEAIDYKSVVHGGAAAAGTLINKESDKHTMDDLTQKLSDSWTEFLCPGNLQSIDISQHHIWCVDKSERLYHSHLSGAGLKWRKVDEAARQIAVSPSGGIVWRLHRGSAYAGTMITARAPAGMKWVEAARDVSYIAVDDNMAW